jgi:hypothetical protein
MAVPAPSSLLDTSPAPLRPLALAHTPTMMTQTSGRRALAAKPPKPPFMRPPPQGLVARVRRRCNRPSSGHKPVTGELTLLPTPFPGRIRHRSTGIWAGAAALHDQGPHCKGLNIPRGLGAKRNSNSVVVLLILVNCVANYRKIKKM